MCRHLTNLPMSSTLSTHCSSLPHPPTQQTCADISLTNHELYTFYPLFLTSSSSNTSDMYRHLTNLPMSSTLSTHCSSLPHPPTQQTCADISLTNHELYTFYPLFLTSSSSNTSDMYRHLTNPPMSSTLSTHCSPLPHPPTQQTCTDISLTYP